ncbi:MAG: FHA domain-containing protein [Planctomycetota bacterium]
MDSCTLKELVSRGLARDAFLAENTAPVLVLDPMGAGRSATVDTPSAALPSTTKAKVLGSGTEVLGPLESAKQLARMASALIDPDARVHWLEKSDRNPFGSLITVGRAPNNDVVIPYSTVSKVHVIFTNPAETWFVADDASANGTFLNGARLTAKEKIAISDGDRLRLGPDVVGRFFLPESLWDYAQLASGAGL